MPDDNKIAGVPLVHDWRNWKRWWSMRLAVIGSLVGTVGVGYQQLSPDQLAALPDWLPHATAWAALLTHVLTGAARVIRQTPDPEGDKA